MSRTAQVELTEKQRQSIFKKLSHFNLFGDSPHIPVKGIKDWPPAKNTNDDQSKTDKKKT